MLTKSITKFSYGSLIFSAILGAHSMVLAGSQSRVSVLSFAKDCQANPIPFFLDSSEGNAAASGSFDFSGFSGSETSTVKHRAKSAGELSKNKPICQQIEENNKILKSITENEIKSLDQLFPNLNFRLYKYLQDTEIIEIQPVSSENRAVDRDSTCGGVQFATIVGTDFPEVVLKKVGNSRGGRFDRNLNVISEELAAVKIRAQVLKAWRENNEDCDKMKQWAEGIENLVIPFGKSVRCKIQGYGYADSYIVSLAVQGKATSLKTIFKYFTQKVRKSQEKSYSAPETPVKQVLRKNDPFSFMPCPADFFFADGECEPVDSIMEVNASLDELDSYQTFTLEKRIEILMKIIKSVKFLHEKINLAHGDLHEGNIIFENENPSELRIIDFDCCSRGEGSDIVSLREKIVEVVFLTNRLITTYEQLEDCNQEYANLSELQLKSFWESYSLFINNKLAGSYSDCRESIARLSEILEKLKD